MGVKLIDGDIGGLGEQCDIMTTDGLALALALTLFPTAIVAEAVRVLFPWCMPLQFSSMQKLVPYQDSVTY